MSNLNPWLKSLLDSSSKGKVEFRPSPLGGLGGFAKQNMQVGDIVFDIPRHLLISSSSLRVRSHPLISKLALNLDVSSEILLFVYMILMRQKQDIEINEDVHYFNSLPEKPLQLVLEELNGTNVGTQLSLDQREMTEQLQHIHSIKELKFVTLQDLLIAKFNYNSRRYPLHFSEEYDLAPIPSGRHSDAYTTDAAGNTYPRKKRKSSKEEIVVPSRRVYDVTQGCLVPLLDVLNHSRPPAGQKCLQFDTSISNILRVTTGVPVSKGEEIFSDYGCVNNDQCLLQFGFCSADPEVLDIYSVVLGGQRYDLVPGMEFPLPIVLDGGYGLSMHLRGKLQSLLQAKPSRNVHAKSYMLKQRGLLQALIEECDALLDEEEED
jgi:hypothetical protein